MYSLQSLSALRWSVSGRFCRLSKERLIMAARAPSPKAHRNSSKSIGPILRDSSSEGIRILRTFSFIETREPVST